MAATVNIRRDVTDPFYRYKMEKLQSKIEGKGNGIKTVIVNLTNVSNQLARPPAYVIKYFGFELGAQTNTNPADDRWIINGAHDASKLQEYLDGFINKFVLCKKCKNPETVVHIKDGRILLDCKACGQRSDVDLRLKLSSFILKNQPKKGKKDKATKKAERKARKEAEHGDDVDQSVNGNSPHDSNSDHAEENGDAEIDAGSDDEFTRRITTEAKELDDGTDEKEVEWTVDTSAEAVKARAEQLSEVTNKLSLNDDEEGDEDGSNAYTQLGEWIIKSGEEKGGIANLDNVEIFKKAEELGIQKKYKSLAVLAQTIFDDAIVKEVKTRAPMLKKMITSEKHEKAFLGGTERLVGKERPNLIPQVSLILQQYYEYDLVSEETLKAWGTKASKKYVDISTSKKVRKSAEKFIEWLENAEEESDEDDE